MDGTGCWRMNWFHRITRFFDNSWATPSRSSFRSNFLRIARANVFAQMLTLSLTPILTRLYTPADYGALAVFANILLILAAFATWRFDWSVPNATSRSQASAVVLLGFMVLLATCLLSFVTLELALSSEVFSLPALEPIAPFVALLPLALLGTGLHQLMQAWYVRENDLSAVSKAKISQSVAGSTVSLAGGALSFGALGLVLSSLVSAWFGIGMLLRKATGLRRCVRRAKARWIQAAAARFGREASLSSAVSLVNTSSLVVTPLLLAHFYTAAEVGWYALMSRLALAPARLFTTAVAQSFWSEAAKLAKRDREKLRRLFIKSSTRLLLLALPVVLLCVTGPLYVGVVLGDNWTKAGYVLVALAPFLLGQIAVSPVSHLLVHRKQHWQLIWDVVRFLALLGTICACASMRADIVVTVLCVSIVMLAMYSVLFVLNLRALKPA